MLRIEGSDAIYPMFNLSLDSHRIKQFDRFFRLLVPIEHNANRAARIEGAVIDLPRPKGTGAVGYEQRLETRPFDTLTVQVVGRVDHIALKLLAASDPMRGQRDMTDLRVLAPEESELINAGRWVLDVRYRRFRSDILFLVERLGLRDAHAEL